MDQQSQADEFRQAFGLHLPHNVGPVDFHGPWADAEIVSNDLVGLAGHEAIQNLPLSL